MSLRMFLYEERMSIVYSHRSDVPRLFRSDSVEQAGRSCKAGDGTFQQWRMVSGGHIGNYIHTRQVSRPTPPIRFILVRIWWRVHAVELLDGWRARQKNIFAQRSSGD